MPPRRKRTGELQNEPTATLKDEVREALRRVLNDPGANAQAKASAARTLMEYFAEEKGPQKAIGEMSEGELDAEIAKMLGKGEA
jgi:hypothetical protein